MVRLQRIFVFNKKNHLNKPITIIPNIEQFLMSHFHFQMQIEHFTRLNHLINILSINSQHPYE